MSSSKRQMMDAALAQHYKREGGSNGIELKQIENL